MTRCVAGAAVTTGALCAPTGSYASAVTATVTGHPQVVPVQPVGTNRLVTVRSDGRRSPFGGATAALDADGDVLVFTSDDPDLLPGHTAGQSQVYVRNLVTGTTELVSRAPDGAPGNGASNGWDVSADGTRVVFTSDASNLVAGDTNGHQDVFLYDTVSGGMTLVSHAPGGRAANGDSDEPSISADGLRIAYTSVAADLDPQGPVWPGAANVYAYDAMAGRSKLITRTYDGGASEGDSGGPDISGDGRRVVFWNISSELVPGADGSYGDVYLYDQATGAIELASRTVDGEPFYGHKYYPPSISADGRTIAYVSTASSLPDDPVLPGEVGNVYVYDVATHVTRLVTRGYDGTAAVGGAGSSLPQLSGDGARLTFQSASQNLVRRDPNKRVDVFVADVTTGRVLLASRPNAGGSANGDSYAPAIASSGSYIAYTSGASNLVARDTNSANDGFVYRLS